MNFRLIYHRLSDSLTPSVFIPLLLFYFLICYIMLGSIMFCMDNDTQYEVSEGYVAIEEISPLPYPFPFP